MYFFAFLLKKKGQRAWMRMAPRGEATYAIQDKLKEAKRKMPRSREEIEKKDERCINNKKE